MGCDAFTRGTPTGVGSGRLVDGPGTGRSFLVSCREYDRFVGRYSGPLAVAFADFAGVAAGQAALDVGCGPGALTGVLTGRLGAGAVSALDPSPPFVAECAARYPGVTVLVGSAEDLPFEAGCHDRVLAQLVLHRVSRPERVAREFARVLRPGGAVAACVWDAIEGMQILRHFWDAAATVDPDLPPQTGRLRFGGQGEIVELLTGAGFGPAVETTLRVRAHYADFEDLWSGFLTGIGTAGEYCQRLPDRRRTALREELSARLGSPAGAFTLTATARCAAARVPG